MRLGVFRSSLKYWHSFKTRRDQYNALHFYLQPEVDYSQMKQHIKKVLASDSQTSVWVHLNKNQLAFAQPLVVDLDFKIHHGLDQQMSLCKWIKAQPSKIIPFSRCFLSCGALVIHNQSILLIQEKFGARKGQFGIPGGRSDFTEGIDGCAERELFEETGIRATFNRVIFLRELEKYTYDAYDLYFVCLMKQLQNPEELKLCPEEIQSSVWLPLSQLRQFMSTRSVGTQKYLSQYVSDLYAKGYDFHSQENQHQIFKIKLKPNGEQKRVVQHFLAK